MHKLDYKLKEIPYKTVKVRPYSTDLVVLEPYIGVHATEKVYKNEPINYIPYGFYVQELKEGLLELEFDCKVYWKPLSWCDSLDPLAPNTGLLPKGTYFLWSVGKGHSNKDYAFFIRKITTIDIQAPADKYYYITFNQEESIKIPVGSMQNLYNKKN